CALPICETKRKIGDIVYYATDEYDALQAADCLLLVTEWKEFRVPDKELMKQKMKNYAIFDGRNIYDGHEMIAAGFDYFSIGKNWK
ncbi:MAG: UDP binding domain-containing protein, partial [Bacteroidales bacterium]|nr:UDP binding domain-containing protein [Bacteroidales bacterium]